MTDIQKIIDSKMDFIQNCYAGQGRYYHTWQHIEEMLKQLENWNSVNGQRNGLSHHDYLLLKLAILFHDISYDSQQNDNEEKSVAIFRNCFGGYISAEDYKIVVDAIMATKDHVHPNNAHIVTSLLLIFDVDVLTKPFSLRSIEIEDQIRKEYAWVPKDIYAVERERVLRRFGVCYDQIAYMHYALNKE